MFNETTRRGMRALLLGASCAVGALSAHAAVAPPSGTPPPQNVTVVNDTAHPVPVAGTVAVSNLPTVQNVNVVNTPGVDPILRRLLDTVVFTEMGVDSNSDGVLSGDEDVPVTLYNSTQNSFHNTFVGLTILNSGLCTVKLYYSEGTTASEYHIEPGEHKRISEWLPYQSTITSECLSPCSLLCQYTITDIRENMTTGRN